MSFHEHEGRRAYREQPDPTSVPPAPYPAGQYPTSGPPVSPGPYPPPAGYLPTPPAGYPVQGPPGYPYASPGYMMVPVPMGVAPTIVRNPTNHVLHLILSLVTCGFWAPVWFCWWAYQEYETSQLVKRINAQGGAVQRM